MNNSTKTIGLSILSTFILTACVDYENDPSKNTKIGVGIGAVAGATAGKIFGDDRKSIVLGTAAGIAIGGLIGHSLDKQEADLRESLGNQGGTITNTGSELIVTLPDNIIFATDSAYVRDSFRPQIYKIAQNLREYSDTTADVIGHTDSTGSHAYNQGLSSDRAHSVSRILLHEGVNENRVISYGRGETSPIAPNSTEDGKAQNRRVEIVIRPKT